MADRFRKQYATLTDANKTFVDIIKRTAEQLEAVLDSEKSRELSLALTKLEEAVFWSTKHFTAPEQQVE